jgi:GTPase SAR1 family protein
MCFFYSKKQTNPKEVKIVSKSAIKKAIKLIVCGNTAVGKTSIVMRYKNDKFTKDV